MTEKVFGYILLIVGLLIIMSAAYSGYAVFMKSMQPYPLFTFSKGIGINTLDMMSNALPPEIVAKLRSQPGNSAQQEIISADMLNFSSNIFAHLMLVGFIASIGFKIASLGTMLMRPIRVQVTGEKPPAPSV